MLRRLDEAFGRSSRPMVRLTYMSQATSLAEHPNFPTAVGDLCVQAQRLNRLYGLTGALIVSRRWFIQTLEGDREAVFATLERFPFNLDRIRRQRSSWRTRRA
jgi:hypothetical protein